MYKEILRLAAPLILSTTGLMFMQFVDAMFLGRFSADAIAAVVPAGMAATLVISAFQGTCGYASTFVAHFFGANRMERAIAVTWQSIYFALGSGVIVALFSLFSGRIFDLVGHDQQVRILEKSYFDIMCWGAFATLLSNAAGAFFSGKGKTGIVMAVQVSGFLLNALLDYPLIFGWKGICQPMGISGAAWATVASQLFNCIVFLLLFLRSGDVQVMKSSKFEWPLFSRFVRFGFPSGLRWAFEMLAWTLFIFVTGRIGRTELAASGIAFRINGIAFFPIIGVAQAVAIMVGQSQGRGDPVHSQKVTWAGLLISQVWMISAALLFVLFPAPIYSIFEGDMSSGDFKLITEVGTVLLRFVALYSLFDAFNIVLVFALQAAGDTRWTMRISLIAHLVFFAVLILCDRMKVGLWVEWFAATIFVLSTATIWFVRFRMGAWRHIKVIETVPAIEDLYDQQNRIVPAGSN